ncbi:acetylxylan esterase [Parabacteroides sp. PF5-9]|uniref:glucuronyl esterase domain-containing protein n=1 Tax=Parabacteroides sp. PF5-9 TaxID=1742404 RepID=UPI002475C10E|nr:acetylxylan esterase [Parabacteroides sp. PF5-9]MDH6357876.1 hypothetical protein [Parabacteroides sp. PF5-9]
MNKRLIILCLITVCFSLHAQQEEPNYDESKVPSFVLSPLLINSKGEKVISTEEWEEECRPEIRSVFADQVYGITPDKSIPVTYEIKAIYEKAFEGKATSKQVLLQFTDGTHQRDVMLLLYLPNQVGGRVPLFFCYNYLGNERICNDPNILPSPSRKEKGSIQRGGRENRWPIEKILAAGYGVATVCYQDFFRDAPDQYEDSMMPFFGYNNTTEIKSNTWQAIGVWAWGMSRVMDYLETDPQIDGSKVILMGHSRQGKAALWAGAQDQRFSIVISNNSGCGGAALSKRKYGETIDIITSSFPYWFCKNFDYYAGNEQQLSFDQHELLALIAPRPLYVASAEDDKWADPKGEFLAAKYVSPVYELYNYKGLTVEEVPPVNSPVMSRVGYHIRTGVHDVTDYDWEQFIRFADKWLK